MRLALKSVWYALIIPNDPYHEKKVNFWNMPVRKRERQYRWFPVVFSFQPTIYRN